MSKPVFVLNGANLNLLGIRDPHLYGTTTLAEIEAMCRERAAQLGIAVDCRQSSSEGTLIERLNSRCVVVAAQQHVPGLLANPPLHLGPRLGLE